MKFNFSKNGTMQVVAENGLEAYALEIWFSNFNKGSNCSVLEIETDLFLNATCLPKDNCS